MGLDVVNESYLFIKKDGKQTQIEKIVNDKMLNTMQSELETVKIENNSLPKEIISTVMSYLPRFDEAYVPLWYDEFHSINYQMDKTHTYLSCSKTLLQYAKFHKFMGKIC